MKSVINSFNFSLADIVLELFGTIFQRMMARAGLRDALLV